MPTRPKPRGPGSVRNKPAPAESGIRTLSIDLEAIPYNVLRKRRRLQDNLRRPGKIVRDGIRLGATLAIGIFRSVVSFDHSRHLNADKFLGFMWHFT